MDRRTQQEIGTKTFSVVEVAECLLKELKWLEELYPHVLSDTDYRRLKGEIETEAKSPNNDTFGKLQGRYRELRACLKRIENTGIQSLAAYKKEQVADGVPATALRRKTSTLADYLPEFFDDFGKIVAAIQGDKDYYDDGCIAASEMIIMGELEAGMAAVIPCFREEVRNELLATIGEHCDEDDRTLQDGMDSGERERRLLELFSEKDAELAEKLEDPDLNEIIGAIFIIRKAIAENGAPVGKRVTVGAVQEAQQTGEIGVAGLWKATIGVNPEKCSPEALRRETAERVILARETSGGGFLRRIK